MHEGVCIAVYQLVHFFSGNQENQGTREKETEKEGKERRTTTYRQKHDHTPTSTSPSLLRRKPGRHRSKSVQSA